MEVEPIVFRHHPIIGTFVEIAVFADGDVAEELDRLIIDEMTRLEGILSAFDPKSELSRWKRGEVEVCSPELQRILVEANEWERRSSGAFTTRSGLFTDLYRRAATDGRLPSDDEIDLVVRRAGEPAYDIVEGRLHARQNCEGLNLNAFAKGWIVDRASDLARSRHGDVAIVVDAGGDLRYEGHDELIVGVENPLRPYDNEPPLARIRLTTGGLATSGGARRGVQVDGTWISHLVDPRTGRPVDQHASITIVAPDTATADVVATICSAMSPPEALEFATSADCGCVVVDHQGRLSHNDLVFLT